MTAEILRKSILQQAIQGKLSKQLPTDGDARALLRDIQAEKNKLIADGKIKAAPPLPPISPDEIPFEIPQNWQWVRLGDIGVYKKGPFGSSLTKQIFVPKGNNAVKVYEQKNAIQKNALLGDYYISKKYFEEKMKGFEVQAGDIIVSCAGTIGESYIMPQAMEKGIINQALMRMKIFPPIFLKYFLLFFDFTLKKNANLNSKGSAIKNIPPLEKLKNFLVPLPPLEEQKRIVAKLEKIMPLLECFDAAEKKLAALDKAFPDKLRKSILQQAIQGKLSEQLPTDGDARQLLRDIQAEKNKLIADGKIKAAPSLPPISPDEIPFEIPENWQWVRLGDIGETNIGLTYIPQNISNDGVIVLRSGNIQNGKIVYSDIVKVTMNIPENKLCKAGDILICARNGSKKLVGKAAIIDKDSVTFGAFMAVFRSKFNPYILAVINSPYFRKMLAGDVGTMTINQITQDMLRNFIVPLPPLEEQKRIVAKLEKILPLCDRLAEKLK